MPEIIRRQDAMARGLKKYFTGKPCSHGHVADRWASTRIVSNAGDFASKPQSTKLRLSDLVIDAEGGECVDALEGVTAH